MKRIINNAAYYVVAIVLWPFWLAAYAIQSADIFNVGNKP
jgi:hypothetical protein